MFELVASGDRVMGEKEMIKKIILSLCAVLFTSSYPVLFIFLRNIDEVHLRDIELPLVTYIMIAVAFFAISMLFFFDVEKASIYSSALMIIFMNFVLIQNIIVMIIPICSFALLGGVMFIILFLFGFFLKKQKQEMGTVIIIINILFISLLLMNTFSAIPVVMSGKEEIKEVQVEQYANKVENRNIYYLLFDEYGGTENLKYYYNYDNSDIKNYLENMGFSWSNNTYNKESIYTSDIVPNILNIDYVSRVGSVPSGNIKLTENPVLYRFFKKMGYEINIVNQEKYLKETGCNVLTQKQKKGYVENEAKYVSKIVFQQGLISVFSSICSNDRIESKSKNFTTEGYTTELDEVFDCALNICDRVNKPSFNVCYILCPHVPFLYNNKGEYIEYKDMQNYDNKDIYIEQLQYVNCKIKEMVKNIIDKDSDSIIVIQSDHGWRYAYHCMKNYKKKDYNVKKETLMMQNALNCVYIGGKEKLDIQGDSCINTWRKILNEVYDTNYDMIECEENYSYTWRYTNVTQ